MLKLIAQLTLGAALIASGAAGAAEPEAAPVKDFDVYVDLPTGFTFVKMPQGWKFVGQLDQQAMRKLPGSVHTWLLPAEEGEQRIRLAQAMAEAS
ncbi:hypothetical protein [Caldimonas sp. KR1-144]|uniref:hypothetical protein n=1 Tax=Caldimonas sp. KR1-144 TaxID=3400911 RepID=UPI003BFF6F08